VKYNTEHARMMASGTRVAVQSRIIIDGFNQTAVKARVETLRQHLNDLGIEKIGDFAFPVSYKRKASLADVETTLAATPAKTAQRQSPMIREVRVAYKSYNNSAHSFGSKRSLHQRTRIA
jgi:hypothetical protein